MSFEKCLPVVLALEGGETITNDPNDPGGLTKYGISQRAFPSLDIANLTQVQAADIYRQHYWRPVRGDDLPACVAMCVFDSAVNQGQGYAARTLQRAVGESADGVLGPKTMAAISRTSPTAIVERVMQLRAEMYLKSSGFVHYGRGWMRRVVSVTVAAMEMT